MPPVVFTAEQAEAMMGETRCEHCGALHKIRRRSLNSTMARQLTALYRYFKNPSVYTNLEVHLDDPIGSWVHASRYLMYQRMERECLKLRFWGFIDERPNGKDDGNPHCGYVRLTDDGKKFCEKDAVTYRYILTKNQGEGFVGFIGGEMINIEEAGGNDFDYSKEIRA